MRNFFYSLLTCRSWSTLVQSFLVDTSTDLFNPSNTMGKYLQAIIAMLYSFYQFGSMSLHISNVTTALIITVLGFLYVTFRLTCSSSSKTEDFDNEENREAEKNHISGPPGPKPWPVYGSLHLLAKDANSWEAFRRLREEYGDVFKITLGRQECIVVSSMEAIREVLVEKAASFSGRPNFLRYHALFGGNRDHSLALCDWSDLQKTRRKLAYPYVFPRSNTLQHLEEVICSELDVYMDHLDRQCSATGTGLHASFDKAHFSAVCANIFCRYFCSKRYSYGDSYFLQMVKRFDDIFHDINNGFALDFLPWLAPFKLFHLSKLYSYGQFIRKFLIKTLINQRMEELSTEPEERNRDFLDAILNRSRQQLSKDSKFKGVLSNDEALYELEDLLGGHSAVSCFWTRLLAQVINREDIKNRIRAEIDAVASEDGVVRLGHRSQMPFTQAVIWETLRVTTSPIVPHVAAQDDTIGGFHVKKDSMIFLNNYYLNLSESHWKDPQNFDPTRFLNEFGKLTKPGHFLPFSTGQRSCLGYQLVQAIVFLSTVKLLQKFDIRPSVDKCSKIDSKEISKDVECAKLSVYDSDVRGIIRPRFL